MKKKWVIEKKYQNKTNRQQRFKYIIKNKNKKQKTKTMIFYQNCLDIFLT